MQRSTRLSLLVFLPLLCGACRATSEPLAATWESAAPAAVELPAANPVTEVQDFPALRPPTLGVAEPPRVSASTQDSTERYANIYRTLGLRVGGVTYGSFDTTVQVGSDSGVGAVIDLEDLLGVDSSLGVLRLDGFYMFNPRHRLDLSYYDIDREGRRTLADPLEIGDVVIPAGDTVSTMRTRIFKLAYRYNFVTDPRTVIGASIGLHAMRIDLGFESQTFNVEESLGVTAPLPVLGLHGAYALDDSWALYASGEVFQLEFGEFGGTLGDFRLGLDWDVFEYVGLGVEMNAFNMSAEVDDGNLHANTEYGYQGIGVYLRGYL